MIVVTGATGIAGSEVVRALARRGAPLRAFVRDPGRALDLLGDGVELAHGDLADALSVRAALEGADALLLSCADDPRRVGWETAAIDAAAAAGVRRIVKLSAIGAAPGSPVAFWDWHGQVEEHLLRSGVPAVVLRSSPYMSNLLAGAAEVARRGLLRAPAGDARIALIDPRDVGEAAAAALTTEAHDGRTLVLSGPAALTHSEVADALSAATGREVRFVDLPDDEARRGMVEAGLPEVVAEQVVRVYAMLRQGAGERTTASVEELTGRRPRDVAAWARDHAGLFAPALTGAVR